MTRVEPPVLGEFELLVLLAVLRLDKAAFAPAIAEEIESTAGRKTSRPAVLITLQRLEDKGLLTSRYGDATSDRNGRAKRFFTPNPMARRAIQKALNGIRALSHGLDAAWQIE
jgi:DNA-binding PadR family transcriptional regulator